MMLPLTRLKGMRLVLEADDVPAKNSDEFESMREGSVSGEDIIEKLNAIRSGKSFKDPEVRSNLDEYFASLSMPKKVALFAFLKGIAQVLTGEISPKKAVEPEDPAPAIQMKKQKYKRVIKPAVINVQKKSAKPVEDTSQPIQTPITPKK